MRWVRKLTMDPALRGAMASSSQWFVSAGSCPFTSWITALRLWTSASDRCGETASAGPRSELESAGGAAGGSAVMVLRPGKSEGEQGLAPAAGLQEDSLAGSVTVEACSRAGFSAEGWGRVVVHVQRRQSLHPQSPEWRARVIIWRG